MSTSNKLPSQVIVNGQIADASGHTDFTGTLDEAMAMIMQQVTKAGKWVYLNGSPFMFQNYDLAEQEEVRQKLANAENPSFMLTAKLQGGALPTIKRKTTKRPISQVLGASKRTQIALSVTKVNGKDVVNLTVSDYNGSKKRLAKHRESILRALFDELS